MGFLVTWQELWMLVGSGFGMVSFGLGSRNCEVSEGANLVCFLAPILYLNFFAKVTVGRRRDRGARARVCSILTAYHIENCVLDLIWLLPF